MLYFLHQSIWLISFQLWFMSSALLPFLGFIWQHRVDNLGRTRSLTLLKYEDFLYNYCWLLWNFTHIPIQYADMWNQNPLPVHTLCNRMNMCAKIIFQRDILNKCYLSYVLNSFTLHCFWPPLCCVPKARCCTKSIVLIMLHISAFESYIYPLDHYKKHEIVVRTLNK